jgi:gamma-glutamylcyclotransferase (GGCT)/AIG2-like uncharacterized protein YtfP
MYSRGAHPYIIKTAIPEHFVLVELFEITDKRTMSDIDNLELSAGYFLDHVLIDDEKFRIYLFLQNIVGDPLIKSGDWAGYVRENRF